MPEFTKVLEVNLTKEEMTQFIVQSIVDKRFDLEPGNEFEITYQYSRQDFGAFQQSSEVVTGCKIVFK